MLLSNEWQQLFTGVLIRQDCTNLIFIQPFCPVIVRIFGQFLCNFLGDPLCDSLIILEIFRQFAAVCFICFVSDVITGYFFSGQSVFIHTRSRVIVLCRIIRHLCMNDTESRIICRNDNIFVNNIAIGIRSVFLLRNQLQRVDIQISHCRNLQCDRFRNVHDQTVVFGSDARTGEADRCGFRRIIFIQLDKGSLAVLAAIHAAFDASVNMFFFTHTQDAVRGFQCQVTALRNRVVKGIVLPCFDGNRAVYGTNLMNRAVFGNCNIK